MKEGPRSPSFDDLLRRAVNAPAEEVAALLDAWDDPEERAAVRELLGRENELDGFLEPATLLREPVGAAGLFDHVSDHAPDHVPDRLLERPRRWLEKTRGTSAGDRRRLGRVGRNLGWISGASAVGFTGFYALSPATWTPAVTLELFAVSMLAASSFAIAAVARSTRSDDRTLLLAGFGYFVTVSCLLALFHAARELQHYGQVSPFGPYWIVMALAPLVLRVPLRPLLLATLAASLAAFAGLAVAARVHGAAPSSAFLRDTAIAMVGSIALAVLVHRSMAALRREIAAGVRLGSYRLIEKLGEGGMGEVWRAAHPLLARPAAIKLVRPEHLAAEPRRRDAVLERFRREARTIAALQSRHTVRLYDFGVAEDGRAFFAMELLDGIDLFRLVRRFGAQPVDRVVAILSQICDSLAEAHERGLVHRDVKPANVMLCRRGRELDQVKVLDFGSVGGTGRDLAASELTTEDGLLGTPAYLAPERLHGESADARSDLYGVGCIAYWLLVGRPVFEGTSPMSMIAAHLRDRPVPPSRHVDLPPALERLVMACLAKDPDARPSSAAELADGLAAVPRRHDWSTEKSRAFWAELEISAPVSSESSALETIEEP